MNILDILHIIFRLVMYIAGIGFFGLIGVLAWTVIIDTIKELRND